MDAGAVWQIGGVAVTALAGGGFNWWLTGYRFGQLDGARAETIRTLQRERKEDKALIEKLDRELEQKVTRQANQFLRTFQAIEQLRRLHKTGNGGIDWTDLVGG